MPIFYFNETLNIYRLQYLTVKLRRYIVLKDVINIGSILDIELCRFRFTYTYFVLWASEPFLYTYREEHITNYTKWIYLWRTAVLDHQGEIYIIEKRSRKWVDWSFTVSEFIYLNIYV